MTQCLEQQFQTCSRCIVIDVNVEQILTWAGHYNMHTSYISVIMQHTVELHPHALRSVEDIVHIHSSSERGTSPQARLPACVVPLGRFEGVEACSSAFSQEHGPYQLVVPNLADLRAL